jgi:serpin B
VILRNYFSRFMLLTSALALCLTSVGSQAWAQSGNTQALVDGNTQFALKLYQAVRGKAQGNLLYSPYSISEALAMTYAGARGETERQMRDALIFNLPQDALHPAILALRSDLVARGNKEPDKATATPFAPEIPARSLWIADGLWGEKTLPFESAYLDLVKANYGAGLQPADFINAPDMARQAINDWVAKETEDRIQNVVPPGVINSSTRLVLANAIYFKNAWLFTFDPKFIADSPFTLLDGQSVSVPMMNQTGAKIVGHFSGEGYQAVELPYAGNFGSMLIILPDSGQFEAVEKSLDAKLLSTITAGLKPEPLKLSMPRFKFTFALSLNETLQAMGMTDAFSDKADFSGMGPKNLFIGAVLHKAFIAVDENGTEAAAATVAVMGLTAMAQAKELRIDRPFIFAIRDSQTGAILFMGRVLNPAAS